MYSHFILLAIPVKIENNIMTLNNSTEILIDDNLDREEIFNQIVDAREIGIFGSIKPGNTLQAERIKINKNGSFEPFWERMK